MDAEPTIPRLVTWEAVVVGAHSDQDALAGALNRLFGQSRDILSFSVMVESGPTRHYSVNKQMVLDALSGKEAT